MGKAQDLTGKKFGRLTVLKRVDDYIQSNGRKRKRWLCECDCKDKTHVVVFGENLTTGHTKSCGCLARETSSKISKKYNKYDLSRKYGVGYTFKDEPFYFDLEDYDKINNYCWHKDNNGYIATNVWRNKTNIKMLMHRLIMGFSGSGYDIDHKHGRQSRNDNRKSNLRIVTHSQNLMNVGIRANNSSSVTGVSYDAQAKKWTAYIKIDMKSIKIGRFESFDDAVAARKDAEEKYFGEYSYDNSMKA